MKAIQEKELNQELINSEDFKIFFVKNWPIAKLVLEKLSNSINRPLLKLAINILIDLGNKLYEKKSKEINITL
jgi:hypothetical protein